MGVPDSLTCLLRNLYAGREATARTKHEQWTGSKLGKEYDKAVYCHPGYVTYMQSTLCTMLGWMTHRLESRLLEEAQAGIKFAGRNINHLKYADDTSLMAESEEELKSLLMRVKEESKKSWLKTQHSEN